jgi:NADH dehydrogenase
MKKDTAAKVVVIGGGFAGLNLVKSLAATPYEVLLIDKTNHHLFQPLLYQVATAALSPRDIALPIREVLKHQANVSVLLQEVVAVDKEQRLLRCGDGETISYDILVLAPGSRHSYFGHPQWETQAPGLKTLSDAINIRERILLAFEKAESSHDSTVQQRYLTFVVVGGGPTGVEMAGAIAEIAQQTMIKNFRTINPRHTKVYLIEAGERILSGFPEELSAAAEQALQRMGVEVLTKTAVSALGDDFVQVGERRIASATLVWAAGNTAAPLLQSLGLALDKQGRVLVDTNLRVAGYPEIFVIGDAAQVKDRKGQILPGMAPVAMQQGKYVAEVLKSQLAKAAQEPFAYHDRGAMATIGKAKAVVWMGKLRFAGFAAWLVWCLIHILYLIGFRNRFFVMLEWAFWYLTGGRSSRLIYANLKNR